MMYQIDQILSSVRKKVRFDPALLEELLKTKETPHPVQAFCEKVRDMGFPLYEMDLLNAGEEYYAGMRRSTNGGGENSPLLKGEDDYYELFMAELLQIRLKARQS